MLRDPKPRLQPHAAIAGWLLPGLGHVIVGQRLRGLIIGVSILLLWTGGLYIGGITVITRYSPPQQHDPHSGKQPSYWYYGQVLIAPSLPVQYLHTQYRQAEMKYRADEGLPALQTNADMPGIESANLIPSLGRSYELGQLFTALAGLLNLLAIIDIVYCDPAYRRKVDSTHGNDSVPDNPLKKAAATTTPDSASANQPTTETAG